MSYVSCMYAPEDPTLPATKQGENARIVCQDDQGQLWWLTEDSEVGDWLRYVEDDGEVLAYDEATMETWQAQPTATPASETPTRKKTTKKRK